MGFVSERTRKRQEPVKLTADECYDIIQEAFDLDLGSDFLNKFTSDMHEKMQRFGDKTFISPKQMEVIADIREKIKG